MVGTDGALQTEPQLVAFVGDRDHCSSKIGRLVTVTLVAPFIL